MKICVLGASGMLGHTLFSELMRHEFDVYGTVRDARRYGPRFCRRLLDGVDALDMATVERALDTVKPATAINAVGLIRHLPEGREALPCIRLNAEFPHLLRRACEERGIRCIHYSTDCVFDGKAGRPYVETDRPTAHDVYGLSKFLGEIAGPSILTIRTSIIGPELRGKHSLLEWFLAQHGSVRGFTRAMYTGLPASEHARVLAKYILPHPELEGLYHVSAPPISKYELLRLISRVYRKEIEILPDDGVQEDKRLSGEAFRARTGYAPPPWPEMLDSMREAHEYYAAQWMQ